MGDRCTDVNKEYEIEKRVFNAKHRAGASLAKEMTDMAERMSSIAK